MYLNTRLLATAAALSLVPGLSFAQQPPERVEEVVVTANRIPVPLRQIATSVSVITEADIQAHGNLGLTDVLRQLPAVSTSSTGGTGQTTALRVRGEEGFRTLVLLDGMRLSDPSNIQVGPRLEHLVSSGVSRVEMLRGPQGLSYGADAGGVLNISTRPTGMGTRGSVEFQGGRYGSRQLSGNLSGGFDRVDFFISGADLRTDGFNAQVDDQSEPDNDGYDNRTLHARIGVGLSETLRAELVHRNVEGAARFDGCYDLETFATLHDCMGLSDFRGSRAALDYKSERFSHSLSYQTSETDSENRNGAVTAFSTRGEVERIEYVGSATDLPGFDLVFGGDLETLENDGRGRDNKGIYLEYLSDFSDVWHFTAGARHDDNDDFGTNNSYRVSGAWLHELGSGNTLKLKGSYGTGFRAPSPYEIAYNRSSSAYPPASLATLRQEKSKGWEAGIEYVGDALHLEAVYFDQDVEDAIFFDLSDYSGYLQDIGTSSSRGVELSAEIGVGENLNLSANYTYNETERPNGMQRLRRPEQLFNAGVTWYGFDDRLALNAFYRVSRDSLDQVGESNVPLPDFEVLDLGATFTASDRLQIFARLENAADENYQEVTGFNTAGVAAYLGFRVNFGGL